jgi:hypothetical protein
MSAPINDGGSAFPVDHKFLRQTASLAEIKIACGMTLRDYFAAQANTSLIIALSATRHEQGYSDEAMIHEAARLSILSAETMIAFLAAKGGAA